MRVTRQIVCFLCLTLLTNVSRSAPPEMEAKLQELIQAIQKNEGLYPSLKLELTRSHTDEQAWLSIPGREPIERVAKISLVTQGKQFREQIQEEGEYAVISGGLGGPIAPGAKKPKPNRVKTGTEIWTEVSNGQVCRILNESLFPSEKEPRTLNGQITDRVPPLPNLARPHRLLQPFSQQVPLSISLQGPKAVRSFKGLEEPPPGSSHTTRTQVLDSVVFQGHPCTRVRMELVNTQNETYARYEYWLAEDRNLIPIRLLRFDARDFTALPTSSFLPTSESFVTDWLEVQPGVWYPQKASVKRFDWSLLRSKDQQVLAWRLDYDVHSVELNPVVKASEFTQLDFPPGTSVSVWEDGKQVRTYEQE